MTPDELWEKYAKPIANPDVKWVDRNEFLAALREYGQAVRDRDAEIISDEAKRLRDIGTYEDGADHIATLAAAISREPLP